MKWSHFYRISICLKYIKQVKHSYDYTFVDKYKLHMWMCVFWKCNNTRTHAHMRILYFSLGVYPILNRLVLPTTHRRSLQIYWNCNEMYAHNSAKEYKICVCSTKQKKNNSNNHKKCYGTGIPFYFYVMLCYVICVCILFVYVYLKWISPLTFQKSSFFCWIFLIFFTEESSFFWCFESQLQVLSGYVFQISRQFIFRVLVFKVLLIGFWIGHLRLKQQQE